MDFLYLSMELSNKNKTQSYVYKIRTIVCDRRHSKKSVAMISSFREKFAFLSNFHPAQIIYNGCKFATAEHAFQAAKCVKISDELKIQQAPSPRMAKYLGRSIHLKPNWDTERNKVMEEILRLKFCRPDLRQLLLETKNKTLVEGNQWHDTYWGVCNCSKHKSVGQNHLGKLLMKIRTEIQVEQKIKQ